MRPAITIRIHDAHLGIWQDDANDPSFREEIYKPLLKEMARRGWKLRADPHTLKHYRILSPLRRIASRGDLRAQVNLTGRALQIEFWAETWPIANPNGRRHDFNKLQRMTYLDRLRLHLERSRILTWLRSIAPVTVDEREPPNLTPMQRIERDYTESWHTDKALGRPRCTQDYNRRSGDGGMVEHGNTVWFANRSGRICRGAAYYRLNSMWWVVAGGELLNLSCGEILCSPPADLRSKSNERQRRARLEAELAKAVHRMDFHRAAILKAILFGDQPTFLIWARDKSAYYRAGWAGYTPDSIDAGRYTRTEAEREVRRVPHELEAIGSNGERIRVERTAA